MCFNSLYVQAFSGGDNWNILISPAQMKSVASEERRIQQQIVAQQKRELTSFLENQKKEYRLCKEKIKEVNVIIYSVQSPFKYETHILRQI